MKKRITSFAVMQTGKVLAVFYGLFSLITLPIMLIGILADPSPKRFPMLLMLLLYPIMGFILGILMAALYNIAAKWIGGIEVSVEALETEGPDQS
jgi:drug/metabolite transporter (DMT)-like permease